VTNNAPDSIAVQCRRIEKSYGAGAAKVLALRGVDLEVAQGELLMVIGPSGCGKTTLLSIISAILEPDAGQCTVLGRDLATLDPDQKTRFRGDNIGFVFQLFNLLPALTVLENVAIPLLVRGMERVNALQRAGDVLQSIELESRKDALPGQLSVGQQQRVAIARSLVHNPSLIVCDEPTSSLDHKSGQEMMTLLRDVAHPDRTLIVVTHDDRILEFADRIVKMDDGVITADGSGSEGANEQ
jgi:putative ABC transport system ATP-binding protein